MENAVFAMGRHFGLPFEIKRAVFCFDFLRRRVSCITAKTGRILKRQPDTAAVLLAIGIAKKSLLSASPDAYRDAVRVGGTLKQGGTHET